MVDPEIMRESAGVFARICGVPIMRNSVLDGFRERWFEESQSWMELSVSESLERAREESGVEKEM